MRNLALFPCSYTDGASIIGQLANSLHLRVYTDEMLFADIAEQFCIPFDRVKYILCRKTPMLHRYQLEKANYINLAEHSLAARNISSGKRCIHYGLHTSLLDSARDQVMKVLVYDEPGNRLQRAMRQEGLPSKKAEEFIKGHDEQVSAWTRFLFEKDAYAPSLYDLVINLNNSTPLQITAEIERRFFAFSRLHARTQVNVDSGIAHLHMAATV